MSDIRNSNLSDTNFLGSNLSRARIHQIETVRRGNILRTRYVRREGLRDTDLSGTYFCMTLTVELPRIWSPASPRHS